MANKKDLTSEELAKACEEAKKNFEELSKQLKKVRQEEEDRRKAELALEKESRKKEVDDAIEKAKDLLEAYVKDYGIYSSEYNSNELGSLFKRFSPWWL